MPKSWSKKEERQYRHIEESAKERGESQKRAKEIAARTVNKGRRLKGKTARKTTSGTGNPRRAREQRTKDELYNRAKRLKIQGRSKMTKRALIAAIRARE
jgi:plasmid stabilization system protein ParE